jgi:inorganic pyrophosphatase
MPFNKLTIGNKAPECVNVVIEIPKGGVVKYELDKDTNCIFVDRILKTPMAYPINYGYIPGTHADDGDPLDAMVLGDYAFAPGSVVECEAVGVMMMEDESGVDEKILMRPKAKIDASLAHINDIEDVSSLTKQKIEHFFQRYKDLDEGKWAKTQGYQNRDVALAIIRKYML